MPEFKITYPLGMEAQVDAVLDKLGIEELSAEGNSDMNLMPVSTTIELSSQKDLAKVRRGLGLPARKQLKSLTPAS